MSAVFPNGIFSWTNRVDETDVVWANDPNSLAAEVVAVESTLGANPQIEKSPPTGSAVTYASVDARISDTLAGSNKPVVELNTQNLACRSGQTIYNSYQARFDPDDMYNGTDVTVPCDGWWLITAHQVWEPPWGIETGFSLCGIVLNGDWLTHHCWRWDFPNRVLWPFAYDWGFYGSNEITWQGLLHKGDRFQVLSSNGTYYDPHHILTGNLKATWLRTATGTFISG